jgi:type III restriction enzyme
LDADFPVDFLPQAVQALSVTPAPDADAKHAPVQRLEHLKTLQDLYTELSKRDFLRDRFIVFPHVGEGGTSTMLRSGFAAQYKSMPCVGGFVDGPVTQHGDGNKDIVNGRTRITATRQLPFSRPPTVVVAISQTWASTPLGSNGHGRRQRLFGKRV